MADLASSAVTLNRQWYEGLQRNVQCKDVTLVLSAQGTMTNKIAASTLGFTKLLGTVSLVKSDNTEIVLGAANYAGDYLVLKAAGTNAPADFTGTYRGVVKGI